MQQSFRQQADASILDGAASVIARQGLAKTSVQNIADAVGLSKAGLLYHFPTKDVLYRGIIARAGTLASTLLAEVRDLPVGPARDLAVLEAVVNAALAHPGLVAMMMLRSLRGESLEQDEVPSLTFVFEVFGDDPATIDLDRSVRIHAAISVVALMSQSTPADRQTATWQRILVDTCTDALGHRRPAAPTDVPTHPEA